jgi:hypothetical protein
MKQKIMIKILLGLFAFCFYMPSLLASDIKTSIIKPEALIKYLPKNWVIGKIFPTPAPAGWKTSKGSKGIRIDLSNPTVTIHHPIIGDYHPHVSFTLMPLAWEGKSKLGDLFKNGELTHTSNTGIEQQIYPDQYQKKYQHFYVFTSYLGKGDWQNPFNDLRKYFETDLVF